MALLRDRGNIARLRFRHRVLEGASRMYRGQMSKEPKSAIAMLTERRGERLARRAAGMLLAWPWFDGAGLFALKRWFFPLSRLWAAARAANGDPEAFYDAVPLQRRLEHHAELTNALARFEEARAAVNAIEAEWQRVFFATSGESEHYLSAVEAARRDLRHAYNATRRHFRFLLSTAVPRTKFAIETPASVAALYGAAIDDRLKLFAAPATSPAISVSASIPSATGRDYWLKFASPSPRVGDTVVARVHEPPGVTDPPTVIYGHGICVEFDHWRGLVDEAHELARSGYRVIRPEAPWHGRRVTPGSFGGERIIAAFPSGIIDALSAAVQEWAVLARWARETSKGPIVFAGSSLGALTSQLAATHALNWPEDIRPEALLLVTHTGRLGDAVTGGALSNLWADPKEIERAGWTLDAAHRYLSLLDPAETTAVPSGRIVSVLGKRDVILPYAGGTDLVERWKLPQENRFEFDRGHFSVPMTLVRDDRPLKRFAEIVAALSS